MVSGDEIELSNDIYIIHKQWLWGKKPVLKGGHFQVGRTPIILLGAWAKHHFKIVFLKNIVQEKNFTRKVKYLNIFKPICFWKKKWFYMHEWVHGTSLCKWYQDGLSKAIILWLCTSPVSELFIACVSAGVKMCLSFLVQSCSFIKCAMLFYGHYNAHLSSELGCPVCLTDMGGCCFTLELVGFLHVNSVTIFWRFTLITRNPKTNENY